MLIVEMEVMNRDVVSCVKFEINMKIISYYNKSFFNFGNKLIVKMKDIDKLIIYVRIRFRDCFEK